MDFGDLTPLYQLQYPVQAREDFYTSSYHTRGISCVSWRTFIQAKCSKQVSEFGCFKKRLQLATLDLIKYASKTFKIQLENYELFSFLGLKDQVLCFHQCK